MWGSRRRPRLAVCLGVATKQARAPAQVSESEVAVFEDRVSSRELQQRELNGGATNVLPVALASSNTLLQMQQAVRGYPASSTVPGF